jgi:hypothetical protein
VRDSKTGDLVNYVKIGELSGWIDNRSVLAVVAGRKRI